MQTGSLAEFDAKFQTEALLIARNAHWRWALRPQQCTLGATVLSTAREFGAWSEMTPDEAAGLQAILRIIETALGASFSPDKLNYLMLMMIDSHVHFHVLPRYEKERDFQGATWIDASWPGPPDLMQSPPINTGHVELRDTLRAAVAASDLPL